MDLKKIKELIKIVEDTGITGLSIEEGDAKVEIKKQNEFVQAMAAAPAPVASVPTVSVESSSPTESIAEDTSGLTPIKSPMTGTFYAAASPDTPPYVKVGDKVSKGQVICIVEAMKTFNEIEADISGTVEKILVGDKDPVDTDQPLVLIKE